MSARHKPLARFGLLITIVGGLWVTTSHLNERRARLDSVKPISANLRQPSITAVADRWRRHP